MSSPRISVIVPVYNVESLLSRCVDSLLKQKFTDYEVLLVDDGSTDSSGYICDEYAEKDSRIRVIHKPNGGVSETRNKGIDEAKGEWITFVDSDDYVTIDYLSDLYACTSPEIGLVVMHSKHIKENGEDLYRDYDLPKGKIVYDASGFSEMVKKQFIAQRGYVHSKLFKKGILDTLNVRFNPQIKFSEDWIFLFRYLNGINLKVCCSPVSNYFYVDREGSLSHTENDFASEYATFSIIKGLTLEFCSKYNADIKDLGPTYLLHKAITIADSRAQLCSIKADDWNFLCRYFQSTSMKTTCDKWIIKCFHSCPSILYVYFNSVRNFRKILEKYNLWSIVDFLRK